MLGYVQFNYSTETYVFIIKLGGELNINLLQNCDKWEN